jgi:hypothetical protein
MSVSPKDQKMLWGKAAARCSMDDCRHRLVAEASSSVPSAGILIGENCHMVGEQTGGPRGISTLSVAARNRYPNLILLCLPHHTIIDQDPAAWPVEKLQKIKKDHELWVDSHLATASETPSDQLYSLLVNLATDGLGFNNWEGVSDHLVRGLVPVWFVDGVSTFSARVFSANWPKTKPDLELCIKNLALRADAFVKQYMTRSYLKRSDFYAQDVTWKRETLGFLERNRLYEDSSRWQQISINMLSNLVFAMNEFSEGVRNNLNPHYFYIEGKFTVYDSIGVTNDLQEIHYLPSAYIEISP